MEPKDIFARRSIQNWFRRTGTPGRRVAVYDDGIVKHGGRISAIGVIERHVHAAPRAALCEQKLVSRPGHIESALQLAGRAPWRAGARASIAVVASDASRRRTGLAIGDVVDRRARGS